ncbi:hypothetical protein P4S73_15570 [Paraglaciecola sp. Hal342]
MTEIERSLRNLPICLNQTALMSAMLSSGIELSPYLNLNLNGTQTAEKRRAKINTP